MHHMQPYAVLCHVRACARAMNVLHSQVECLSAHAGTTKEEIREILQIQGTRHLQKSQRCVPLACPRHLRVHVCMCVLMRCSLRV
jgi:hypothetical protein